MGQTTGFIEFNRIKNRYRSIEERIKDYREVEIPLPEEELKREGARCMDCGIPFCHSLGCPLNNLIPEWNDLVYLGKWYEAWERLELTNNFPEITGRLCPAPCETSCTLAINRSAVSIKHIERAIIEKAFAEGWVKPKMPERETGKRVAVIGSGPAGLAAAQVLRRLGHGVTVFEKAERIGGILRFGIPDFKLEKSVLDRRLKQIEAEGVNFETDVIVGEDISVRYLRREYDAVLLAVGAGQPRDVDVPGSERAKQKGQVVFALDYLKQSNLYVGGNSGVGKGAESTESVISASGKNVLVIGGGDTGSDCVGTALRQRADSIIQVEILPEPKRWEDSFNPQWPDWPKILRTSTSHEEGEFIGKLKREWSLLIKEIKPAEGVKAGGIKAHFVRLKWSSPKNGSRPSFSEIPGSDFYINADLTILAMGFIHVEHSRLICDLGINLDKRGNVAVNADYETSEAGVFAAGDAHSGASLVVRAINNGRRAAFSVNSFLSR
ncbi:MAG: glutamate synthase subunit beta [Spirochaetales bacterium]|nr:glutamate synthase subunit beta [Spirochaetales bacterium]